MVTLCVEQRFVELLEIGNDLEDDLSDSGLNNHG